MTERIPVARPYLIGNEKKYVLECVDSGWVSSAGRFIGEFEAAFADACQVEHAVACSSGTAALHLALKSLGVGEGDTVLVPSLTFIASANAVRYCGATPIFVDSQYSSMNIDPQLLERAITSTTRGIIAVHLYGLTADMDAIASIAARHGLFVLEDAAEAIGARYRGRVAGGLGDVAIFSFFGNKIITTGEGGMITTNDSEIAAQARLLRGQAMSLDRRYWFDQIGYNYRLTNMQAALGLAQVERLSEHCSERHRVAALYRKALRRLSDFVEVPPVPAGYQHAYWMFTVLLREQASLDRDQVADVMSSLGVETRPVFYPVHSMPPYERPGQAFPVAESLARTGLTLPTYGGMTEAEVTRVVQALEMACRKAPVGPCAS